MSSLKNLLMVGYAELWTDGACNNNTPNGMGLGIVIRTAAGQEHQYAARAEEYDGKTTSNIAEYLALLHGVDLLPSLDLRGALIRCDSEVLVKGITGEYELKDPHLMELRDAIQHRLDELIFWSIAWIPRERNKEADKLSKIGITCDPSTFTPQRITL